MYNSQGRVTGNAVHVQSAITISVKQAGKKYNVNTVNHCIFCLRKISANQETITHNFSARDDELEEVPCAPPEYSTSADLLFALNKIWSPLQKGGDWDWDNDEGNSDQRYAQFTCFPKICYYCAADFSSICDLMCQLKAEINKLGVIIRESKKGGAFSWRGELFERTLKDSAVERQCISDTLHFLGIPQENQSSSLLPASLGSRTIGVTMETEIPSVITETFLSELPKEEETSPGHFDFHDEGSEDDASIEYDDTDNDPNYVKEEEDAFSNSEDSESARQDFDEDFPTPKSNRMNCTISRRSRSKRDWLEEINIRQQREHSTIEQDLDDDPLGDRKSELDHSMTSCPNSTNIIIKFHQPNYHSSTEQESHDFEGTFQTKADSKSQDKEWDCHLSQDSETPTDDEDDQVVIPQQFKKKPRSTSKTKCRKTKGDQVEKHGRLVHSQKHESAPSEESETGDEVRGVCDPVKYKCTKCIPPKLFKRQKELAGHQKYMHSNGKVALGVSSFGKKIGLTDMKLEGFPSITRHHPCPTPECGKIFTHEGELEGHIKLDHNNSGNPYGCQFCKVFTTCSALKLIDHELEHTNKVEEKGLPSGKKFVCGRCDFVVVQCKLDIINHYLEAHLNHSPLLVTCPICQKGFHGREKVPLAHYLNYHDLHRLDDPDNPFRCKDSQCSAYFLTEEQLHVHWNRVHPYMGSVEDTISRMEAATKDKEMKDRKKESRKNSRKCPHCPMTFAFPRHLKTHLWTQHDPRGAAEQNGSQYNRRKMVISFPEDGLTVHDLVNEKKVKYCCEVADCGKGFMEEADLATHSKLHGEFQCGSCPEVKSFAIELAMHETVHKVGSGGGNTKDKAYRCSRCDFSAGFKGFYLEHFLDKHLGLEGDKKRCPICRMVYRYKVEASDLVKHDCVWKHFMEYHHRIADKDNPPDDLQLHHCERADCRAYFLKASQVREHVLEVHENISWKKQKEDAFKCVDCGKQFPGQRSLRGHRRNKHNVLEENFEFICTVAGCGQRFEKEGDLERHNIFSHAHSQQIECPVDNCDKKFWTKSGLRSHQQHVHEGKAEKSLSLVCDECGKSFAHSSRLKQHNMLVHTDPASWKFECSVCQRKIISAASLKEHMRVHTKERPFVCEICGLAYSRRNGLKRHVSNRHGPGQEKVARKRNGGESPSKRKRKSRKKTTLPPRVPSPTFSQHDDKLILKP